MKKIYNGTPHAINIVTGAVFSPSIRKWVGGNIVLSIPSNGVLNAKIDTVDSTSTYLEGIIPMFIKKITGFDPLPDGYDIYIVSALYYNAVAGLPIADKCFTVSDPVMTDDGNTFVGCRGLMKMDDAPAVVHWKAMADKHLSWYNNHVAMYSNKD